MGKNIEKNKLNIGTLIGEYGAYIALVLLVICLLYTSPSPRD